MRDAVAERDRYLCQECKRQGRVTPFQSVDHIKPEAEGGLTVPSNLEALCASCHKEKTQAEALRARQRGG
jgi:5-methylcytosine-specific restriction protein A